MDDEILTKSFQRGMKGGISQRRAQQKKRHSLVWPGARMASKNKGRLRTHTNTHGCWQEGQSHRQHFHLDDGKRKEAIERRREEWQHFSEASPRPHLPDPDPADKPPRPGSAWQPLPPFQGSLATALQFGCVCACVLLSSCVCTSESSWCDPTLRGRLIWLGVFGLCQSACLRHKCSHNWLLCSKCHSSQRKRKDPIADLALFPIALPPPPTRKKKKKSFWTWKMMTLDWIKKKNKTVELTSVCHWCIWTWGYYFARCASNKAAWGLVLRPVNLYRNTFQKKEKNMYFVLFVTTLCTWQTWSQILLK